MNPESADHDHCPPPPEEGTEAVKAYFRWASSDLGLFHFIIDIVLRGDYTAFVAKQALAGSDEYKRVHPVQLAKTDPGRLTKVLREKRQVLLEMHLARLVDNFQAYLVALIRAVLHAKPQMLSNRQQTLSLEEVLKYDDINELVHDIIERRVNALAYEGFGELQLWCAERGLQIEVPADRGDAVLELIATRNVIVHNRGMVDDKYVRAVSSSRFKAGQTRQLEVDDYFGALALLHQIVANTDRLAAEKFHLPIGPLQPQAEASSSASDGPEDEAGQGDPV